MKLSVSLSAVFSKSGLSTSEKIKLSAEIGYEAVEFWSWWGEDVSEVAAVAKKYGVTVGSVCTKFASLVDPTQRAVYMEGLRTSIDAARQLDCRYLISQTGNELPEVSREEQTASLIAGLKEAAPLLEAAGIVLVVEPLNTLIDHPGCFLSSTEEAADVIRAVNSPNVKLLYDVYHQQITEGDLIRTIRKHSDIISYYHIADHPGRHEPGTGEINYDNVLRAIRDTGYTGYIGLEYFPSASVDGVQTLRNLFKQYGSTFR